MYLWGKVLKATMRLDSAAAAFRQVRLAPRLAPRMHRLTALPLARIKTAPLKRSRGRPAPLLPTQHEAGKVTRIHFFNAAPWLAVVIVAQAQA